MSVSPGVDLAKVILVDQFGQRFSPIMPDLFRFRTTAGHQFRQVRQQIVTAAASEFSRQIGRPVRAIGFKRIGKDCIRWRGAKGLDQRLAHGKQMGRDRRVAERVQNPPHRAHGGPFHPLAGVAGQ